jgi:hypothetical protein
MKRGLVVLPLAYALGIGACSDNPVAPERLAIPDAPLMQAEPRDGTGLVVDNLTGVSLPIVGEVATLDIDQAVITNVVLDRIVGGVIGLTVTGTVTGEKVTALGSEVVSEEFTSTLTITPSGGGGCKAVDVNLGPLTIDALGLVTEDVQTVSADAFASGAAGGLICALGSAVSGAVGGVTRVVENILGTLNRLI